MHDVRWPLLQRLLVHDGWVWRDDTLYAPNETLWFSARGDFGDRLDALDPGDRRLVHADLESLVSALDQVLRGN
jgi:hypothetical protein